MVKAPRPTRVMSRATKVADRVRAGHFPHGLVDGFAERIHPPSFAGKGKPPPRHPSPRGALRREWASSEFHHWRMRAR